jgi:hypothetical protein
MAKKSPLYPSIIWHIKLGDLVKITKYDFEGDPYHLYGVVVSQKQECQIELFPYVDVYVFGLKEIFKCYPNSLEIISRSKV